MHAKPASTTYSPHAAVVTFYPQVPGSVTNGTIAGVLNTQELIAAIAPQESPPVDPCGG